MKVSRTYQYHRAKLPKQFPFICGKLEASQSSLCNLVVVVKIYKLVKGRENVEG